MEQPTFGDIPEEFRSGYVAIIGQPNVGKSTLLNALVGRKLSIVTPKPQTTRHRVLGILSGPQFQCIFLDTPGIIQPHYRLHEAMMHAVESALGDADLLLFMVDARRKDVSEEVLSRVVTDRPALLVLNKIDLIKKEDALPLADKLSKLHAFESVIPISALNGYQVDVLKEEIIARLPPGPPYYPPEIVSEHPERFFVSEIIREKIFEQYRQEIPYSTQVNIVVFEERDDRKDFIDAEIVVERETQKGILIGKGGSALKRLGTTARRDIEAFLERSVYLQLHIKVRADWRDRPGFLRSYGYE